VSSPDVAAFNAPQPRQLAWVDLLRDLATQVEHGTVYDRHLIAIAAVLDDVVGVLRRRTLPLVDWRRRDLGVAQGLHSAA
jgi:hypothetical protein